MDAQRQLDVLDHILASPQIQFAIQFAIVFWSIVCAPAVAYALIRITRQIGSGDVKLSVQTQDKKKTTSVKLEAAEKVDRKELPTSRSTGTCSNNDHSPPKKRKASKRRRRRKKGDK